MDNMDKQIEQKTQRAGTYLPLFPGFYNTILEPDEEFEAELVNERREEHGLDPLDYDDIDFDYNHYETEIIHEFARLIEGKVDFIEKIEFQELIKPREYNFHNDSVNIIATVNVDMIRNLILRYENDFRDYLYDHYTTRDGFMPYYSNQYEHWYDDTNGFTDFSETPHQLGSILTFLLRIYEIYESDIYMECETRLEVKNMDHELSKRYCPECDELVSNESLYENYKGKLDTDLALINKMGTIGNKTPQTKPFQKWLNENFECPECGAKL